MPSILHRRASSTATLRTPAAACVGTASTTTTPTTTSAEVSATAGAAANNSKSPSVFRYTLILLKARPSRSDLDTISVYAGGRAAPLSASSSTLPTYQESESGFDSLVWLNAEREEIEERVETPPPPYES